MRLPRRRLERRPRPDASRPNVWMVRSIRKRVRPVASGTATIRLRSASSRSSSRRSLAPPPARSWRRPAPRRSRPRTPRARGAGAAAPGRAGRGSRRPPRRACAAAPGRRAARVRAAAGGRRAVADHGRRQQGDPRGGELDAEGQVVEQRADLLDDRRGLARDPSRPGRPARDRRRAPCRRRPTGATGDFVLAGDVERRPAGDDDPGPRRGADERRDIVAASRTCSSCRGRGPSTGRRRRTARPAAGRSGPSKRPIAVAIAADLVGSVERGQGHEPGAVRDRRCEPPRRLDRRGSSCRSRPGR